MLADYASVYKSSSSIKESNFIDPLPGVYNCRCLSAEHKSIPKEGARDIEKFTWTFKIIDGECQNLIFQKVEFLSDPEKADIKLGYIKGSLERCGITPPADVRDLPYAIQKCANALVEVTVIDTGIKSKDGKNIKNVKITKSIENTKPQSHLDNDFATAQTVDEIPF